VCVCVCVCVCVWSTEWQSRITSPFVDRKLLSVVTHPYALDTTLCHVKTLFRISDLTVTERKRASQFVSFKRNSTRLQAAQVRKILSTFLEAKHLLHSIIFPPRDLNLQPYRPLCDLLPHFYKINFIVIFPSIPNIVKWYFPFRCLTKNFI
jgi:hypothetical protein